MSRLGINTGSNPNDGQGDPLRIAMGKINSNFTEIYNTIGDGNNLISYASTAGISTLAQNLTGSPRINVSGVLNSGITTTEHLEVRNITSTGVVTATQFVGDGSQLTNVTALVGGLEVLDDNVRKGVARELNFGANIVSTGPDGVGRVTISVPTTVQSVVGYATASGIATVAQGLTGAPNINAGIITATSFIGDGSGLSGVAFTGTASTITSTDISNWNTAYSWGNHATQGYLTNVNITAGANIDVVETSEGNFIITSTSSGSVGSAGTWAVNAAGIHTSKNVGIGTTISSSALTVEGDGRFSGVVTATRFESTSSGTPTIDSPNNLNINAINVAISTDLTVGGQILSNQVGISSFLSVTGISTFYNNVHFDYDKYVLIGANDELQLFHNGSNSYIDNSSGNNLVIRTHGSSILLEKEGPELMGAFNTDGSVELYYNNSKKFETTGYGVTIFGGLNVSGIITASSFRPTSGYIQAADGTNSFYIYSSTGNVAFQGTIGASQLNSASGNKVIGLAGTDATFENNVSISGVTTSLISVPTQLRSKSVAEKTTLVSGNTVSLTFNAGGGNVAICTNPSGDITLNVTDIPTGSSFDNHSISFSVFVNQTGTARTCTAVTLNGVSKTIKWSGGSLANAISGVTTSTGYDIFTFTGINTVGSASTTDNYVILGSVNGGFN